MKLIDRIAFKTSIAMAHGIEDILEYKDCMVVQAYLGDYMHELTETFTEEKLNEYADWLSEMYHDGHAFVLYDDGLRIANCWEMMKAAIVSKIFLKLAKLERHLDAKKEADAE